MRINLLPGVAVVLSIMLLACDEQKRNPTLRYFAMDSLVHAQALLLTDAHGVLTKQAEINGEEELKSYTPRDTSAWLAELDIFYELKSISKKGFIAEYKVKDTNSNLLVNTFTGIDSLGIVYLKAFYLETPKNLRRIEARYHEENTLLKGSRHLVMEFEEIHNKITLISYSIEGGQKMFLGDPVQFSIKGTITLP